MQPIQLHDNISFEKLNEDLIIVQSNNPDLESKGNLAYKAASILKDRFDVKEGVKIFIEKTIPMSAGLGGGSSNAANTLVTLNKTWDLNLTQNKLIDLGAEIGSDVPFFIEGNTSLVEGMGDKIKPLRKSISLNLVLVNPGIKVSTSWAYKQFDKGKKEKNKKDVKELINAINKKDIKKISENIHNDFDAMIEKKHKIISEIKTNLKKLGSLSSLVSGSGPTVFGVFDSIYPAREAYFKLKDMYPFVYLTKTF
jgi:4-diphosphocytidyl-2-C-methyl-D-erythritol kinase|tara:strand:- start:4444 stop:5202 length:759 start_codon:yes stop_codon:yes gene_type:complete